MANLSLANYKSNIKSIAKQKKKKTENTDTQKN